MSVTAAEATRPSLAARTRLLLEGPIVSTLLRLSAPNLVVNVVLITVTTSVDAHFIGRLGPAALAGLALVFPLLMLMQQMTNATMGSALAALGYAFIGMNTLTSAFQAMGQTFWPLMGVLSRAAVLAIGGWLAVSVMDGGVIGLATVTAAGLAAGGSIVAVAFLLGMRHKLGGSS